MKKKLIGILTALLIVALAIPAFAAVTDTQKTDVNNLLNQIAQLRKQIVDKYVEGGTITKDQGELMKKNIDQATKYQEDNSGNFVPGAGCGGAGYGNMMGGAGYGNMMGGFGYRGGNANQNTQWTPGPGQAI